MSSNILRRLRATPVLRASACALVVACAFSSEVSWALGSDTVFLSGTAGITYDDNLFRLDSGISPHTVDPQNSSNRDTFIYRYGVGLRADVPYSRQRFVADLNLSQSIYSSFHQLNYFGGSGNAAWLWQVGNDLSGDAGITLSRTLQNYGYTNVGTQKNVVQNMSYYVNPRYRIAPNFELQVGLNYATGRNSGGGFDVNDTNTLAGHAGVAYVTPAGSQLGLQYETWKTKFPNILGAFNDYRDNRFSTFYNWALTGASQIDGSFGYKQRRHEEVPERDFNGWTGTIGWNWTPTGKTRTRLFFSRDVGGIEDLVTTYARTYTLSFTPSYQLTSKISLNGTAQYQDLAFFGNTGFVNTNTTTGTLADRHDKISTLGLGLGYQVTRIFSMGLNYTWSHRNSNVDQGNFDDNMISLNGSVTF